MIKLIHAMLWNPNSDIKLCPLISFVWHFHLKTDTANWKLTYSDLSVLDNFVSARFYCAGNVLFCSSGCLILFYFSLFSPDGAVMCSALQCSSAPVQQQLSPIIRDSRSPRVSSCIFPSGEGGGSWIKYFWNASWLGNVPLWSWECRGFMRAAELMAVHQGNNLRAQEGGRGPCSAIMFPNSLLLLWDMG